MDTLNDHLKKRLAQRFLGNQALGVLTLRFLHKQFPHIDPTAGYIRHHKLFVFTKDQETRIQLFANKKNILLQIKQHLVQLGYTYNIQDILLTTKGPTSDISTDVY